MFALTTLSLDLAFSIKRAISRLAGLQDVTQISFCQVSFPALSEDGMPKTSFPGLSKDGISSIFPRFVRLRKVKSIIPRFIGRRNVKKHHSPVYQKTEYQAPFPVLSDYGKSKHLSPFYWITEGQKTLFPGLSDYGISKASFPVLSDYGKSKESFPILSEDEISRVSSPSVSDYEMSFIANTPFPKSVIPSVSGREMSLISYLLSLFQVVSPKQWTT